jgi:hypothetical protein
VQAYVRHEVPGAGSLPGSLLLGVTTVPGAYRLPGPLLLGPIIVLGAEVLRPFLLLGVYGFLGPRILGHLTFISIIAQVKGLTHVASLALRLFFCGNISAFAVMHSRYGS